MEFMDLINGILFLCSIPLSLFTLKYLIDADKIKSYFALLIMTVSIFSSMFIIYLLVLYYFGTKGCLIYTLLSNWLAIYIIVCGRNNEVYKS